MDLEKRQTELEELYNDLDQRKLVGIILELTIENIDLKKQLSIHSVVQPETLDNYESGCVEHKQQIQAELNEEQFYCFDEEDDLKKCNEQCMSCRSVEDARKPQ